MKTLLQTATNALLDEAMSRHGLTTNYQLAKHLKWPQSDISTYRSGRVRMGVRKAYEFAKKTGIPLETVAEAIIEDEVVTRQTFIRSAPEARSDI
tara:strand:+ start:240 stop:524 length:285 start_codon:yes stop_codon:yes gene_type:complete